MWHIEKEIIIVMQVSCFSSLVVQYADFLNGLIVAACQDCIVTTKKLIWWHTCLLSFKCKASLLNIGSVTTLWPLMTVCCAVRWLVCRAGSYTSISYRSTCIIGGDTYEIILSFPSLLPSEKRQLYRNSIYNLNQLIN